MQALTEMERVSHRELSKELREMKKDLARQARALTELMESVLRPGTAASEELPPEEERPGTPVRRAPGYPA